MKKVAWILASGALIMACGGGPSRTDSGPEPVDAGGIVLLDSGTPPMGRDTGAPRRDSGPSMCTEWGGLTATSISPVPASCMPRCSNATLATINMCPMGDGGDCLFGALMADTTPPVAMPFDTTSLDLDCGFCFDLQRFHCFSQVCPDSASPFLVCDRTMDPDMCMGELDAINACLMAIPDGSAQEMMLNTCFETQVTACFDVGSGFLPGGQQIPDFQWRNIRNARGLFAR